MPQDLPRIELRPGDERPVQTAPGVLLRPGLAFGAHYDPERTAFGALVAHNRDTLAPGAAYGAHSHRDTEILTWVHAGTLVHVDADGVEEAVAAGGLQYLDTGTGWHHDERAGPGAPAELVQMWFAPALDDPPPGAPRRVGVAAPGAGDVVLAGPGGDGLVALRRPGVRVLLLRLAPSEPRVLDDVAWRHVHVLSGSAAGAGPGDTLEVSGRGPCPLRAGEDGAELLVVATDG